MYQNQITDFCIKNAHLQLSYMNTHLNNAYPDALGNYMDGPCSQVLHPDHHMNWCHLTIGRLHAQQVLSSNFLFDIIYVHFILRE